MPTRSRVAFRLIALVLLLSGPLAAAAATAAATAAPTGFLVLAPDRGFLGNEEMRDVFDAFRADVPEAVLAFATAEQTTENLQAALEELAAGTSGLTEVVVLPFFLSEDEALYRQARAALDAALQAAFPASARPALRFAAPFGQSYLAEEVLFDRVAALLATLPEDARPAPAMGHGGHGGGHGSGQGEGHAAQAHGGPGLVLVGSGAATPADEAAIRADLEPLVRRAAHKFGLTGGRVAVLYDWSAPDTSMQAAVAGITAAAQATAAHGPALVVPFNLSPRLTTMMTDWRRVQGAVRGVEGVVQDGAGVLPHPNALRWLVRTANGYRPLAQDEIGVILVPHGSDYNWNRAMRAALAPIKARYVTEEAFSMVDPFVVERAVRRLEARGVKAAVLVRIFSLESSFKEQAEYILGLRPEYRGPHAERIASHLRFATAGGLEAHPYLADAMLQRAREISTDPARETVVLVAHGTGGDDANAHWMENLGRIAAHIEQHGDFRDVRFHTWREDWPDKREASIRAIRTMVEEAGRDGGTALVIPVRTIDQGPEATFLEGLTYRHGTGFAPHPSFVKWVEEMIRQGTATLAEPLPGDETATR